MDYQNLKKMSAQDMKDCIQDVLDNKAFASDPDNVDDSMHQRLMLADSAVQGWTSSTFGKR